MYSRTTCYLALAVGLFALVAIFAWIPLDTRSGIVEFSRRRYAIGDGLAPTIAAIVLLLGAVLVFVTDRNTSEPPAVTWASLWFMVKLIAAFGIGVLIMRYAGTVAVALWNLLTGETLAYRYVRDAVPWKHIGYGLGGVTVVAGVISLVEGRVTLRNVLTGIAMVAILIAIFDLPFQNLLLPPNGGQ